MLLDINTSSLGYQQMYQLKEAMLPYTEDMIHLAQGLGCLGSLMYVGFRSWKHLANAEAIDFFPMLRPFAMSLCITLFTTLIIPFMDELANFIASSTNTMAIETRQEVSTARDDYYTAMKNAPFFDLWVENQKNSIAEVGDPENGFDAGDVVSADLSVQKTMLDITGFSKVLSEFWTNIVGFIQSAVQLFINWGAGFYLITLTMLGPLVFGLACFPGLEHLIQKWFCKYIAVSLWVPLGNICMTVNQSVYAICFKSAKESLATVTADPMEGYMTIFGLVTIFAFAMIPSMAEWIMPTGGMGGIASKPLKTASSAAGAATAMLIGQSAIQAAMVASKTKK